ncbi:MAG: peptide ABC transporter substrate-binding protein [Candidatus Saccharimonadales bacterium]
MNIFGVDISSKLNSIYELAKKQAAKTYKRFIDAHLKNKTLRTVERFVFSWGLIFALAIGVTWWQLQSLDHHYLTSAPAPGGQYIEGVVGDISGINPIFSDGQISEAATHLIFSGLLKEDSNSDMQLDLASGYEVNEDGTIYTFNLREDIYWHDGVRLTAEDVAFTIDLIQNPDVGSPYYLDWRDIEVEVTGELSIRFQLPNTFAPFLTQLSVGILPKHLLADTDPERIRISSFNQQPIGSGPFELTDVGEDKLRFRANKTYHLGAPMLDRFTIAAFDTAEEMRSAYLGQELAAMLLGDIDNYKQINNLPNTSVFQMETGAQVFAFFNTNNLSNRNIRRGLVQSIDNPALRRQLGVDYRKANSPLLPMQLGYVPSVLDYDLETARSRFEAAGLNYQDGKLYDDSEPFVIRLVTQDSHKYPIAADSLKKQWELAGVGVELVELAADEFREERLRPRDYDVLLFGVGMDKDPDAYSYWHSSEINDPGRNLSLYQSELADLNLEDGRTRLDTDLRAAKYGAFQSQWRLDAPALPLYRLHAYYIVRREVADVNVGNIINPLDRFHNVEEWSINAEPALQRLVRE